MKSKSDKKIIAKFIKDVDISSDNYITVAELSTTLTDGLIDKIRTACFVLLTGQKSS